MHALSALFNMEHIKIFKHGIIKLSIILFQKELNYNVFTHGFKKNVCYRHPKISFIFNLFYGILAARRILQPKGSNCVPAFNMISRAASFFVITFLYERSFVMAS